LRGGHRHSSVRRTPPPLSRWRVHARFSAQAQEVFDIADAVSDRPTNTDESQRIPFDASPNGKRPFGHAEHFRRLLRAKKYHPRARGPFDLACSD
jgi:hypothetical protein